MEGSRPVRGTQDFGPEKTRLRRKALKHVGMWLDEHPSWVPVQLPLLERQDLLRRAQAAFQNNSQKLTFDILKRGAKYDDAIQLLKSGGPAHLSNEGLIFDHTLSLLRYHISQHGRARGASPTKKIFCYYQEGPVFRAERPQNGRYRQFTQIDLDIVYAGNQPPEAKAMLFKAINEVLAAIHHGLDEHHATDLQVTQVSHLYYKERFQLIAPKGPKLAVGGGGCYDGYAEKLFGANWGGVGFAFGLERLMGIEGD